MRGGLVAVALALAGACGGDGGGRAADAAPGGFDRSALLGNLATNVMLPTYVAFDEAAAATVPAIEAYCGALETPAEAETRAAAQDAWRRAIVAWQHAEAALVGPAAMDERALRDQVYPWPHVSTCAIDQDVMLRHADPGGYDITTRLTNRRGLPAVEYALFAVDLGTQCAPQNAPEGWSALSDADKRAARCAYAAVAAADLAATARSLAVAWSPDGGNYAGTLAAAGEPGSGFESAHAALAEIVGAMLYVESDVKEMKLGEAAGIVVPNACGVRGDPCPEELESPFADHGKENIVANLRGLEAVYDGNDSGDVVGIGFDDWLEAAGAPDVAARFDAELAAAIAAVDAIPGTLGEAIVSDREAVVAAHAAVDAVTDTLKTDFLTVLGIDIPDDIPTDND
jgi:predicted lipoprotein